MNRCIVCGNVVSKKKAHNVKEHNWHEYLVCCPMCETAFSNNPDYYINIARVAWGEYTISAHNQKTKSNIPEKNSYPDNTQVDYNNARLLRNLLDNFEQISRDFKNLRAHFESLAGTGGLGGLRRGLTSHRRLLQELSRDISVHRGVCEFLMTLSESEFKKDTQKQNVET